MEVLIGSKVIDQGVARHGEECGFGEPSSSLTGWPAGIDGHSPALLLDQPLLPLLQQATAADLNSDMRVWLCPSSVYLNYADNKWGFQE